MGTTKKKTTKTAAVRKSGPKKTAAKKAAAKPEVAPITEALSVRATMIADIPPVPQLKRALVSWVLGKGELAERDSACLARELSMSQCHFCGGDAGPSMHLRTPWAEVELCPCLAASTGAGDADVPAEVEGVPPAPAAPQEEPLVEDHPIEGYHEHLPGWQARLSELVAKAKSQVLYPNEAVYENKCNCGKQFTVTVGMVARSHARHGAHLVMTRCWTCRDAIATAVEAKALGLQSPKIAKPSNAAKPHKKKKKNRDHGVPAAAASTGGATVTMGDALGAALAELRAEAS